MVILFRQIFNKPICKLSIFLILVSSIVIYHAPIYNFFTIYFIFFFIGVIFVTLSEKVSHFIRNTWYGWGLPIFCSFIVKFMGSVKFWHIFEVFTIVATIVYSGSLYYKLRKDKKISKDDSLKVIPLLILGFVCLVVSTLFSVGGILQFFTEVKMTEVDLIWVSRKISILLLLLSVIFFSFINFVLSKSEAQDNKMHSTALRYSDLPTFVTIALLLILSFALVNPSNLVNALQYEAFYGGVVTFQLISSHMIWSFIDDKVWNIKQPKTE